MPENDSRLIVHIGFGKTSTSQLQDRVFPYICQKKGFDFWGNENNQRYDPNLTKMLTLTIARMWLDKPLVKIGFEKPTMISNEGLSSYRDAGRMLEYAEKNLAIFGANAHIVLVIREPRSWLRSIYIQRCIHENPTQEPQHFFLTDDEYSVHLPNAKFNLDKFDYHRVINHYRKLFKTVTVVKYEALPSMQFLAELFDVNEVEINEASTLYSQGALNRGLSSHSVFVVKSFNRLLSLFNLSYKPKYSNQTLLDRACLDRLSDSTSDTKLIPCYRRVGRLIFGVFDYKIIMFKFIDKLLPRKKFHINFENFKSLKIQELSDQYADLENVITYSRR